VGLRASVGSVGGGVVVGLRSVGSVVMTGWYIRIGAGLVLGGAFSLE
jgi:hypothetical protein